MLEVLCRVVNAHILLELALSTFGSMLSRTASCNTLAEGVSVVGNLLRSDSAMAAPPSDLAAIIAATCMNVATAELIRPKTLKPVPYSKPALLALPRPLASALRRYRDGSRSTISSQPHHLLRFQDFC